MRVLLDEQGLDWDEAWAIIADRLPGIIQEHGRDSVGVYMGNPGAHSLSMMLYNRAPLAFLDVDRGHDDVAGAGDAPGCGGTADVIAAPQLVE